MATARMSRGNKGLVGLVAGALALSAVASAQLGPFSMLAGQHYQVLSMDSSNMTSEVGQALTATGGKGDGVTATGGKGVDGVTATGGGGNGVSASG